MRSSSIVKPGKRLFRNLGVARFTEPPKHEPRTIALARELHNAIRLNEFGTAHRLLDTSDADGGLNVTSSINKSQHCIALRMKALVVGARSNGGVLIDINAWASFYHLSPPRIRKSTSGDNSTYK